MCFWNQREVKLFWTWANYLKSQTPETLTPVFVNMDETSLPMGFLSLKGNCARGTRERVGAGPGHDPLPTGVRKGAMTLAAFISSDPALQEHLPQILIGNEYKLTKRCMTDLRGLNTRNLIVWSAKSAWVNHKEMANILKTLRERLEPHVRGRQIILVMDVARAHISPELTNLACRLHMWLMFVPRRLTWLLQPLDVCVFRTFKAAYRRRYTAARSRKIGGLLNTVEWIEVIRDVVAQIFQQQTWARAFDVTGIAGQAQVSEWIRQHADLSERSCAGRMLTQEEVQALGGTRVTMPWEQLMRGPSMRATGALGASSVAFAIANAPAQPSNDATFGEPSGSASSALPSAHDAQPGNSDRGTPKAKSRRLGPPRGVRLAPGPSPTSPTATMPASSGSGAITRPITRSTSRLMEAQTTPNPKRACSQETSSASASAACSKRASR